MMWTDHFTHIFLVDRTSWTATQMISTGYQMTTGHGQISTYYNKGPFKFVFVVYWSILVKLLPNGRNN